MKKKENVIVIDTDVKYKSTVINNTGNLRLVRNAPKIIKIERSKAISDAKEIKESISRMKKILDNLNGNAVSSVVDSVSAINVMEIIGESLRESLNIINEQICSCVDDFFNRSQEAKDRERFLNIAEENSLPIFLETDTLLQKCILRIVDKSNKNAIKQDLEKAVIDYYDTERIDEILNDWMGQTWIESERKKLLKEAIDVYKLEYYGAATSTLMCQIGGVITRLYNLAHVESLIEENTKEYLKEIYNMKRSNSEKMKAVTMMDMQTTGILNWYRCANYIVHFIYSSDKKINHFSKDPGRNKICHGEVYNYRKKLFALKSILSMDMIIQLNYELLEIEK